MSNIKYKEDYVTRWEDPGKDNKKLSLIDLTAKGGDMIKNDGSVGDWEGDGMADLVKLSAPVIPTMETMAPKTSRRPTAMLGISRVMTNLLAVPPESLPPANRGQGGLPPSLRCDLEALSGRLGRQETCIVNAAIMASSSPHGSGGKKFNKPIVLDIDLPMWEQ
jgi:hypothetical protein